MNASQSALPQGGTLLGVVLSSDKTNISAATGDRVAHPLLLTLANLSMDVRMKSTYHALPLLALLPCPKFIRLKKPLHGIVENRLIPQWAMGYFPGRKMPGICPD